MNDNGQDRGRRHKLLIRQQFQYDYILVGLVSIMIAINVSIIITLLVMGGPGKVGFSVTHGAVIGAIELLLVAILGWFGLKKSHAIAGPIWVLEREMALVAEGDLTVVMRLRAKDKFKSITDSFNAMTGSLREHIDAIKGDLKQLSQHAESSSEFASIVEDLTKKVERFKTVADVTPEESQNED